MIKIYQIIKQSGSVAFETTNIDKFDSVLAWFRRAGFNVTTEEFLFEI